MPMNSSVDAPATSHNTTTNHKMGRKLRGWALISLIAGLATFFLFGNSTKIRNVWESTTNPRPLVTTARFTTTTSNLRQQKPTISNNDNSVQKEEESDTLYHELKLAQDLVQASSQETAEWKKIAQQKDQKLDQLTALMEQLLQKTKDDDNEGEENDEKEETANTNASEEQPDDTTDELDWNTDVEEWSSWINTSGVILSQIVGDPNVCTEVIYTGDNRDPLAQENNSTFVYAGWRGLARMVQTHQETSTICAAFFQIPEPFLDVQDGQQRQLHAVWARLPATALVMKTFPQATYFLYMDSDALPAYSDHRALPSIMYKTLSYDGYGEDASFQYKHPGLIVNKPATGWMCSQCEKFGLGHGCFNTGVLLWRKSKAAQQVIQAWWEARLSKADENFVVQNEQGEQEEFPFWSPDEETRLNEKMGEQTRLYYVYASNPAVHEAVWPVPQQKSDEFNSSSCPNGIHGKMPCLQYDFAIRARVNPPDDDPACFINHYADKKEIVMEQAALLMNGDGTDNE